MLNSRLTDKIPLNLISLLKNRNQVQGQVKKGKKGQILKFWNFENSHMFLIRKEGGNPMKPLVFVYVK